MKDQNITNDDLAIELAELTCRLAQSCNEKESYFSSQYGITPAEFKCLKLFIADKSLSIKVISSQMNITPGRITHILTSLESKGYITREADKNDKRNVIVTLTEKSDPFIKNLSESHLKLHKDMLSGMEESERQQLVKTLKDLLKILKPYTNRK